MDQSYVSPVVEIRVDSGAWQRLTLSSVERNRTDTTFTGAVELAKGMHTLEVRAVRDGQPLASAPSVKFGIGEVIIVTGQSNSANFEVTEASSGHNAEFKKEQGQNSGEKATEERLDSGVAGLSGEESNYQAASQQQ